MEKICKNCEFFKRENETMGRCWRMPEKVDVGENEYCGEFTEKEDKDKELKKP